MSKISLIVASLPCQNSFDNHSFIISLKGIGGAVFCDSFVIRLKSELVKKEQKREGKLCFGHLSALLI